MDITNKHILPFNVSLSFELLQKHYQDRFEVEENEIIKTHLNNILICFNDNPNLVSGITTSSELEGLKDPIGFLLGDLFPEALTLNEIKAATIPFQAQYFIIQSDLRIL